LFSNKTNQPHRVLIHGLAYFSQKFPAFLKTGGWEFRTYAPRWSVDLLVMTRHLYSCDLAYTWGGRISMGKFLSMARGIGKKKLVMFWCGSDVLEARAEFDSGKTVEPWIAEKIHWAGSPWLAEEVRAMGLNCEYVPSTWVPVVENPSPLPKQFTVLAYLPDAERVSLYGIDHVLEVARNMPSVQFDIVGLQPGQTLSVPQNVNLHGRVGDLTNFFRNSTVVWRPARHDGLSFMALEALAHARHVIWSYPFTGSFHARDAQTAQFELQRLLDLHETNRLDLNSSGAEYTVQNFAPHKIREGLLNRWNKIIESPATLRVL
jgi:hypothetical protein